ncbi:unnamed protein product, partial [Closterium sp. NIES-65]
ACTRRLLCDGFERGKKAALAFLEGFKTTVSMEGDAPDKDTLKLVARTTLRTKVWRSGGGVVLLCACSKQGMRVSVPGGAEVEL